MSAVKVKMTVTEKGVNVEFKNCEVPRQIFFNGELKSDIEGLKAVMQFVSMYCARRKFVFEELDKTTRPEALSVESSDSESDSQHLPPAIEETKPQGEEVNNVEQGQENGKENSEKVTSKKSGKKTNKKGDN